MECGYKMSLIHKDKTSSHENKLIYAILIIIITMVTEVIGGIISNSLALLSDAGHMFTDFISLLLSWLAYKVAMKNQTHVVLMVIIDFKLLLLLLMV